ncbi:MAG: biopolymer transporter ExbD [Burkholderiaceae bacterium]|nr:biopolymer transporter ExbD [Burkholderiaceae bacterium]
MNFRRRRDAEHGLDINVIPLIDILLVMLIFLASTTAFTRYSRLEVVLPEAASTETATPGAILAISQDGRYALDGDLIDADTPDILAYALRAAAARHPGSSLTINADGRASHQYVVNAMEAARIAGLEKIDFATRSGL